MTSRVTHLVTLDQDPPHRSLLEYLRDKRSKPEDFIEIRGRLQAGALRIVNKRCALLNPVVAFVLILSCKMQHSVCLSALGAPDLILLPVQQIHSPDLKWGSLSWSDGSRQCSQANQLRLLDQMTPAAGPGMSFVPRPSEREKSKE